MRSSGVMKFINPIPSRSHEVVGIIDTRAHFRVELNTEKEFIEEEAVPGRSESSRAGPGHEATPNYDSESIHESQ